MEPPEVIDATLYASNFVMTREELEDTIAAAITSYSRKEGLVGLTWYVDSVMRTVDEYIAELNKESREETQDPPLP